ncbi:MAG: hypothetical protein H6819_07040 [Phycisphaerales bacterium]|nr:hypothetical protein [Phycisphaerales bacterium]MCB9855337.1 hypothetical protein [Phycisphaerales bacterium]MCB9862930.1 hypothetical protein [Phycisphaerales bacterium]
MPTSDELRARFRAIPREVRDLHQDFAIRAWRGISWLERAEHIAGDDLEGRFLALWIGLNALYGQLDQEGRPWGDREALTAFISRIYPLDSTRRLGAVIASSQKAALGLIDNKHLFDAFWADSKTAMAELGREVKQSILRLTEKNQLPLWRTLMSRLYLMRNQLFHGASTKGSALNRKSLRNSVTILAGFLPACLEIMIAYGVTQDWGPVCYPPKP